MLDSKRFLISFFRRNKNLYLVMMAIMVFSVTLCVALTSIYNSFSDSYESYLAEYGIADIYLDSADSIDNAGYLYEIEGVDSVINRLSLDIKLLRDSYPANIHVYSFADEADLKFYEYAVMDDNADGLLEVYLEKRFADNNNINAGDIITLCFDAVDLDVYVAKLVGTPESAWPNPNRFVTADTDDYGYIYISEGNLRNLFYEYADTVIEPVLNTLDKDASLEDFVKALSEYEDYQDYYNVLIEKTGYSRDEVISLIRDFADNQGLEKLSLKSSVTLSEAYLVNVLMDSVRNQTLVMVKPEYDLESVKDQCVTLLEEKGDHLTDSYIKTDQPSVATTYGSFAAVKRVMVICPIVLYIVALILVYLFLLQVIHNYQKDIGIMYAIGIDKKTVYSLFSVTCLIMCVISLVVGFALGIIIAVNVNSAYVEVFNIPYINYHLDGWLLIMNVFGVVGVGQLAVIFSLRRISCVTPINAINFNSSDYTAPGKKLTGLLSGLPLNVHMGINLILHDKQGFFTSVFAIGATLIFIFLSLNMLESTGLIWEQTYNYRFNCDAEVYTAAEYADSIETALSAVDGVRAVEHLGLSYVTFSDGTKEKQQILVGAPSAADHLFVIPDSSGNGSVNVSENGVIIDSVLAEYFDVNVGDSIYVNNQPVTISAVSYQYSDKLQYVSLDTLSSLNTEAYSVYLVDTDNRVSLSEYISEYGVQSYVVYFDNLLNLSRTYYSNINKCMYILLLLSFITGLFIVTTMTMLSYIKQKRTFSILRSVGYTLKDISKITFIKSFIQLLIGVLIGYPGAVIFTEYICKCATGANDSFPYPDNYMLFMVSLLIVILYVAVSYVVSLYSIKSWNLANNLKTRE